MLRVADLITIPESVKREKHRILHIEHQLNDQGCKTIFFDHLDDLCIPTKHINYRHFNTLPQNEQGFMSLLHRYTGALLHEMNVSYLNVLIRVLEVNPRLASRTVVIKTGNNIKLRDWSDLYANLETLGVFFERKPYIIGETVVRVLIGAWGKPSEI